MTKKDVCEKRTEQLLEPLMQEFGFELVDVEYVKEGGSWYLRAYIDKPGGITINDCEAVSRRLSDILDEEDYIEESYTLEVSSPGLGRPLRKDKDFQRSLGEEVDVKLFAAVDHSKEYTGLLKAFDKESVTIELEDGTQKQFPRNSIALIRLSFDF
jgi:ribosome maturation factor RimP